MSRYKVRDIPYSLRFNGSSSYVRASSLTNMSLGYSVGVWVKLRTINGGAVFTNATAANDRCGITTSSTGFVRAGYYNGTSYVDPVSSDSPLVPGRWTHIAHVFDGSSSSLYVNGVLQSGTDQPAVSANNVLELGRKQDSTLYIHADLSEFVVQKGVQWTQSDVINVMNGIFPSGMERIYRLDEGAGTTAYDSSGNGNDGTITNGTWSTDSPSKARTPAVGRRKDRDMKASLRFDGVNDSVRYGSEPALRVTGDVTLQVWIKHASLSGVQSYIMCNNFGETGDTNILYSLGRLSSGRLRWLHEYSEGNNAEVSSTNVVLSPNRWYNLVAVRDTSAKMIRFYVDGVILESVAYINDATGGSATTVSIGETTDNTNGFNGYMAEARIWNRALTDTEIADLHVKGTVPSSGLLLDPNFGQGAGTTVADRSASGFTGTIIGATFVADTPLKSRQPVNRNLVYNGDFEYAPPFVAATTTNSRWIDGTAAGSTTNSLFGWWCFEAVGSVRFDDSVSHSGNGSLLLAREASDTSFSVQAFNAAPPYKAIPVLPNTSYTLTYWMKTEKLGGPPSSGARVVFSERSGGGVLIADTPGTNIFDTTDWTQYTITKVTTASTRYIMVKLVNFDVNFKAWFDDIVLKPTTPTSRQLIS